MHDPHVSQPADSIRRLVEALSLEHPRSAYGGVWALAGFSLQAGIFLLHFFDNLTAGRSLPTIEELSDITCPADGKINLVVQVKRTLGRAQLAKALKEFALIIRLAEKHQETAVLEVLRFQIACGKREANAQWPWPADATLADDVRAVLPRVEAHQADPFIVEQADPLDDLWALLWSQGIRDPQAIIRRAAGRLLESFGRADPRVYGDLVSYFEDGPRRDEGRRTGSLVLAKDVTPSADAASSRRIVVGSGFGFRELREGCFRERPRVFDGLRSAFAPWLMDAESRLSAREIPVFWIDGRSGEGKSVLLRQLVAHVLLRHPDRIPVIEVNREAVPEAVQEHGEAMDRPALLVTDDLYALRNREAWDERLSRATETNLAPVSILTCGPTEQREEFERRFSEPFRVTRFTVPPFEEAERQEFVDWFSIRTGKHPDYKKLTAENALLVQLMFELAEGTTLVEFARRFRRRLELTGALAAVQRILSLSALYLETPEDLLAATDERDLIKRLSQGDQRHFRLSPGSVNFAHAHLAGEILKPILETSYPRIPWEIAWARELASVLAVSRGRLPAFTHENVVRGLVRTPRLNTQERCQALQELYSLYVAANNGTSEAHLLPEWLATIVVFPDLTLEPSPIDQAVSAIDSEELSAGIDAGAAVSIWKLKDLISLNSAQLSQRCWAFLQRSANRYSHGPTVVDHFLRISSSPEIRRVRACEWLDENCGHRQAYHVLAPLVTSAPNDQEIRGRALLWLDDNAQHPQAYWLLSTVVAAAPNDEAIQRRALLWLDNNTEHPQTYQVMASLVKSAPNDEEIRSHALRWLDNNAEHPQAYQLLAAVVAAAPNDEAIRSRALRWLEMNAKHPEMAQLLVVLIARSQDDQANEWIKRGIEFVRTGKPKDCASVLAATVVRGKARHDVIDYALDFASVAAPNQRGFILHHLGRACIYNPSNALSYISSCQDRQRRRQVAVAIARAILKYEVRVPELIAALEEHPLAVAVQVLSACVQAGVSTPEFLAYLAQALNRGFHQPGYRSLLGTLGHYPAAWKKIEPVLHSIIKEDFRRILGENRPRDRGR